MDAGQFSGRSAFCALWSFAPCAAEFLCAKIRTARRLRALTQNSRKQALQHRSRNARRGSKFRSRISAALQASRTGNLKPSLGQAAYGDHEAQTSETGASPQIESLLAEPGAFLAIRAAISESARPRPQGGDWTPNSRGWNFRPEPEISVSWSGTFRTVKSQACNLLPGRGRSFQRNFPARLPLSNRVQAARSPRIKRHSNSRNRSFWSLEARCMRLAF